MPLKWNTFRVANYLLLLISFTITGTGTYFFADSNHNSTDFFYYLLFATGGAVLITNYSLNIFLLERHYPEGEIPSGLSIFIKLILLFSCITIGFLTVIYAFEFYDTVLSRRYNQKLLSRPALVFLSFGMILLITYYVFWMQVALRKTINRNRKKLYTAFLETR